MKVVAVILLSLLVTFPDCHHKTDPRRDKVYSEIELQNLRGKTRDEVAEIMGRPNGAYTREPQGRWHYSHVRVQSEGAGKPREIWMLIYFSQVGDQRSTVIDMFEYDDKE